MLLFHHNAHCQGGGACPIGAQPVIICEAGTWLRDSQARYYFANSSSAVLRRSKPARKPAVSPPMPIRKCCGISKNVPGTTVVSYFSRRSFRNASGFPRVRRGKNTVPAGGRKHSRSRRESRNASITARFALSNE